MTRLTNRRLGRRRRQDRRGAVLILMALMIPVLLMLSSFAINAAYLQLSRTELMVATDAAARAGGRAMSHYQDVDQAKTTAQLTAAMNYAGGSVLRIRFEDANNEIEFGDATTSDTTNRFGFSKVPTASIREGTTTANAMRVNGKLTTDSLNGPLAMIFPTMGAGDEFNVVSQAVAMQVDRDIALILDRSGSMGWKTYQWPNGADPYSTPAMNAGVAEGLLYTRTSRGRTTYQYSPGVSEYDYLDWAWQTHYDLGTPPPSPWQELVAAVDTFLQVLERTDQTEQVSLASYASTATLDLALESNFAVIRSTLDNLNPDGNTAIGVGMQTGIPSLLDTQRARPFAAKTLIVMTDGMHNTGIDPVTVAQQVVSQYDVTIHTVTFGSGADQARMQQVAEIGGGSHYHAADGAELIDVFEEIANNLPTIVTQ